MKSQSHITHKTVQTGRFIIIIIYPSSVIDLKAF